LIYDRDVARAALLAVTHPAAAGRIYNVTDGQFHTLKEIIESICAALGRRPPRISLPLTPARAVVGMVERGCRSVGIKPIISREMVDIYTEDIAVEGRLIQQELGFVPQYDMQTGWEETIRQMHA
jgi:UDP-glucose 4-epimerase